jgi:hypothetical protein
MIIFFSNMTTDTTDYNIQISLKPKTFITTFALCGVYSKNRRRDSLIGILMGYGLIG